MIRIALADDHQIVLDGIRSLIERVEDFHIIGEANNGKRLLEIVSAVRADVVLVDIDMPVMNGLEAIRKLVALYPNLRCLALTMHNERGMMQKVMQAGASGYVLKNIDQESLIEVIRKVNDGQTVFSAGVKDTLEGKSTGTQPDEPGSLGSTLTQREVEILKLIAQGLSNKEIGDVLFISHRTVDTHRTNLMKKLDVHNIAGLIRYAIKSGYVE